MKLRGIIALALMLGCVPALAQETRGTSPLSGAKGGTNNSFMQFSGPAGSLKTYTLPNINSTLAPIGLATITANTLLDGSFVTVLCNAGSGAITITLPSAAAIGPKLYNIKKIDATANACTVVPPSGNIDNLPSLVLSVQNEVITLQASSTQWWAE